MIVLCNGMLVDEYTAATALVLEARRQGKSYGQLVAADGWRQEKIILDYLHEKRGIPRRRRRPEGKTCGECAMWRRDPARAGRGECPVGGSGAESPRVRYRKDRACTQFEEKM